MTSPTTAIPPGRVAGIDYGRKRIGIAICDASRIIASPFGMHAPSGDETAEAAFFRRLVSDEELVGFVVGLPVDVLAFVPAWVYYQSLPRETRDPVSVFLFSSFVLWKVGVLVGAPFDVVEAALWRPRRAAADVSESQREAIEREWDARGAFPVYPVTPIVPPPDGADGASAP